MEIRFSRHAKRRTQLYKISESTIRKIISNESLSHGRQEIIRQIDEHKYPLKIILSVEKDIVTIITNYPLKKGRRK